MSLAKTVTIAGKEVAVPVTVVDQVVNFFNPTAGAERFRSRLRMAISGGYSSADKTRRANQRGSRAETDADGAIIPDLKTLREDSQHLLRNSPLAVGAVNTNVTKVVGTGLKVKAQIDRAVLKISEKQAQDWERAAEREFRLATETREIDAERGLPFSLLQGLAFLKALEDGDVFVNMPRLARPGSPYKLKLQLIEAARICNPDGAADTATLICGVEKDTIGAPMKYHVANVHPGARLRWLTKQKPTWTALPAFDRFGNPQVLHLMDKRRPGQTRGVPYLAPVIELIKQLGRYTDAEVMAAVVSGMMTVFVTTESGDASLGDPAENTDPYDTTGMELGHGSIIGLTPDAKVESFNPNRPNTAFDPFIQAVLRQIGVALEIPFELLIKHFTASYSAARAALEEAWDYFRRRRHWLEVSLCQPVYEAVITEAVANGRLKAPGFFADPLVRKAWLSSVWIGDAKAQIDPLKEINAAARRIELTISTLDEESRKFTGTPWEDKLPQVLKERAVLRENGITITTLEQVAAVEPDADDADGSDSDLEGAA
ncbi:MAG: phage portal protein [Deltaproteobacteria bacterium]|nr:MAG: phage portal protein [Deltaproteobacteria bacterium]